MISFGHYSAGNTPAPIVWIKVSMDCDFISKHVLDFLKFDEAEQSNPNADFRYGGNPDYMLSNIRQFLNSQNARWYHPAHEYDKEPTRGSGTYATHTGFLHDFEDYEIQALVSEIELPKYENFMGSANVRFPYFTKKGIRPNACEDFLRHRQNYGFNEGSYVGFWTSDRSGRYVGAVGRDGRRQNKYPVDTFGIRPVCKINPEVKVETHGTGICTLIPVELHPEMLFSDDELSMLLGLR